MTTGMKTVIRIDWNEYERGWGQRPDGTSLHRTPEIAEEFVKSFWEKNSEEKAPDEYSAPETGRIVEVSDALYERTLAENTIWVSMRRHPSDEDLKSRL